MNILIFGLPGSGKTTLAEFLRQYIKAQGHTCAWFNADKVREMSDDWEFSDEARYRASERMNALCNLSPAEYKICDFVAPTNHIRNRFDSDFTIFMDTIQEGRFQDTNKLFERPEHADITITEWKQAGQMAMEVFREIELWRSSMVRLQHTQS